MTQTGMIVGKVEFRPGEGPMMRIPRGRVEIATSRSEATLSWVDGDTHGATEIPLSVLRRYLSKGAIALVRA